MIFQGHNALSGSGGGLGEEIVFRLESWSCTSMIFSTEEGENPAIGLDKSRKST